MTEIVETPNTQLQKVTLLVAMHDYENDQLNAGEWLLNVLMACAERLARSLRIAQLVAKGLSAAWVGSV